MTEAGCATCRQADAVPPAFLLPNSSIADVFSFVRDNQGDEISATIDLTDTFPQAEQARAMLRFCSAGGVSVQRRMHKAAALGRLGFLVCSLRVKPI